MQDRGEHTGSFCSNKCATPCDHPDCLVCVLRKVRNITLPLSTEEAEAVKSVLELGTTRRQWGSLVLEPDLLNRVWDRLDKMGIDSVYRWNGERQRRESDVKP